MAEDKQHTVVGDSIRKAAHKANEYGEMLADKGDALSHKGQQAKTKLEKEIEKNGDIIVNYIKKYPVKSTLIAAGIGFLAAKLFKS